MSSDEGVRKAQRPKGESFLKAAICRTVDLVDVYQPDRRVASLKHAIDDCRQQNQKPGLTRRSLLDPAKPAGLTPRSLLASSDHCSSYGATVSAMAVEMLLTRSAPRAARLGIRR